MSAALIAQERVALARAHAEKRGITFVDAYVELGFDARPIAADAPPAATPEQAAAMREVRQRQVDYAKAHAAAHGVDFLAAFRQLFPSACA